MASTSAGDRFDAPRGGLCNLGADRPRVGRQQKEQRVPKYTGGNAYKAVRFTACAQCAAKAVIAQA
jgi:hypothetical protein